jgi:hypothetical protein
MRATYLLVAATMAIAPTTALADYVVVAATQAPATYAPGTEIATDESLSLPEGARLTLIERSGRMTNLDGAFDGPVPLADNSSTGDTDADWSMLKRLIGSPEASSTVLGAARTGASDIPPPPGIWDVSADSSGPRCVRAGELTLWRRNADTATSVTLRSAAGRHDGIAWPVGEHRLAVPDEMARENGRLVVSLGSELRDFDLSVLPDNLGDAPAGLILAWLAEKDCRRQALALVGRVHAGAALD